MKLDEMEEREQALHEEKNQLEESLAESEDQRQETAEHADVTLERERNKIREVKQERDRIRARLVRNNSI